jgi:divalent metal cation (Fe/Co/Zn/Cd) transporter
LFGFLLGWIPALILALVVAVAMIYLWPLAAVVLLYAIYRVLGVHPHLLNYIAVLIAICAIAIVWWWHMVRHNNMPRARSRTIKAIQHTVRYTELSPTKFKDFWALIATVLRSPHARE